MERNRQRYAENSLPPINNNNEEQKTDKDNDDDINSDGAAPWKVPFVEKIEALNLMDLEFYRREITLS